MWKIVVGTVIVVVPVVLYQEIQTWRKNYLVGPSLKNLSFWQSDKWPFDGNYELFSFNHTFTHIHTGIPAHIHILAWNKLNSKDELHLKRARNNNNNVCVTTFKITFKLYRTRILIVCKCFQLYVWMMIVCWLAGWLVELLSRDKFLVISQPNNGRHNDKLWFYFMVDEGLF